MSSVRSSDPKKLQKLQSEDSELDGIDQLKRIMSSFSTESSNKKRSRAEGTIRKIELDLSSTISELSKGASKKRHIVLNTEIQELESRKQNLEYISNKLKELRMATLSKLTAEMKEINSLADGIQSDINEVKASLPASIQRQASEAEGDTTVLVENACNALSTELSKIVESKKVEMMALLQILAEHGAA